MQVIRNQISLIVHSRVINRQLQLSNWNQDDRIHNPCGGVFKFNLCVFHMEFQLLEKAERFRPRAVAILWKLSKIGRFIRKHHLWATEFIRVRFAKKFIKKNQTKNNRSFALRKYKAAHRFIGIYEGRKPKLFILDPELVGNIYVKLFKHFQVNDSSSSVSVIANKTSNLTKQAIN